MTVRELLEKNPVVIADGAMGTMLQKRNLKALVPEELNITNKAELIDIHTAYIRSGAQILYANTFGANRIKAAGSRYALEDLIQSGIRNARQAAEGTDVLVALDMGSTGKLMRPSGELSFEEAYDVFKEQVLLGKDADLIAIETMTDLYETKAALLAAKENSDLPVFVTMTFEENARTFMGTSVSEMALTLEGLGADAIGVNCSLGPQKFIGIVRELSKWTTLPIIARPNAGLPNPETNEYEVSPEEFASAMKEMAAYGVCIMGGCCGTTPAYISELCKAMQGVVPVRNTKAIPPAVCSGVQTVVIDEPRVIGERINPTGKKLLKQALIENDPQYILEQAIEQVNAGADILDVNVGIPDVDEQAVMVSTVRKIQAAVNCPLQIDSANPRVLESALRIYNGKPIVNSVNGKEENLNAVLPLVKKYGAAVVALTLDEKGIPKTAEDRIRIAEKILNRALSLGIKKENIIIDCLTLTVSAEQNAVFETLNAVKYIKETMGLKTVLGVSNISFGLPHREMINQNFLAAALVHGLDLPIINPNVASMMGAVRSYKVLKGMDENAESYIACYNENAASDCPEASKDLSLSYAVEKGLADLSRAVTEKLLETEDAMKIVNEQLIPALDKAGSAFESGKIFLPQLISSAEAAQTAFEAIKMKIKKESSDSISRGKIILATVQGDIHDIGKNIVKVLLENYGFTVIDLGKDVPCETVLRTAMEEKIKLVGLSALMTTTLGAMEETIALLRSRYKGCKIMVGGAVLTKEYAEKIGADYYAKDAKASVDYAKKVFK